MSESPENLENMSKSPENPSENPLECLENMSESQMIPSKDPFENPENPEMTSENSKKPECSKMVLVKQEFADDNDESGHAKITIPKEKKKYRTGSSNRYCCVPNCHNHRKMVPKIRMFSFSKKNPVQADLWRKAINRTNSDGSEWFPSESHVICCKHFHSEMPAYARSDVDYIPTIFPIPTDSTPDSDWEVEMEVSSDSSDTSYFDRNMINSEWHATNSDRNMINSERNMTNSDQNLDPIVDSSDQNLVEDPLDSIEYEQEEQIVDQEVVPFDNMDVVFDHPELVADDQNQLVLVHQDPVLEPQVQQEPEPEPDGDRLFWPPNTPVVTNKRAIPWFAGCEYRCQIQYCWKMFYYNEDLRDHIKRQHSSPEEYLESFHAFETKSVFFDCAMCRRSIKKNYSSVFKHMKETHYIVSLNIYQKKFGLKPTYIVDYDIPAKEILPAPAPVKTVKLTKKEWQKAKLAQWANQCTYRCKLCSRPKKAFEDILKHIKGHAPNVSNNNDYALVHYVLATQTETHKCLICKRMVIHDAFHLHNHFKEEHPQENLAYYYLDNFQTLDHQAEVRKRSQQKNTTAGQQEGKMAKKDETKKRKQEETKKRKEETKKRMEETKKRMEETKKRAVLWANEYKYLCKICDEHFATDSRIRSHLVRKHNTYMVDYRAQFGTDRNEATVLYECHMFKCKVRFPHTKREMTLHARQHHKMSMEAYFQLQDKGKKGKNKAKKTAVVPPQFPVAKKTELQVRSIKTELNLDEHEGYEIQNEPIEHSDDDEEEQQPRQEMPDDVTVKVEAIEDDEQDLFEQY